MIIKQFKVTRLNQNKEWCFDLSFNQDINILTGKNGSGKTTLLKLIWYLISGNIERIIPKTIEENALFEKIEIETDTFSLSIRDNRTSKTNRMSKTDKNRQKKGKCLFVEWNIGNGKQTRNLSITEYGKFDPFLSREILKVSKSSIFFPTFRRMEGGFFTTQQKIKTNSFEEAFFTMQRERVYHELEVGLNNLSKVFSVAQHKFITSLSTEDIVNYIARQYADISEKTNQFQKELAEFITERTVQASSDKKRDEALSEIQNKVNEVTQKTDHILQPFTILSKWVAELFQYQGIKLTDNLSLGEATNALSSEKLSSGEKQMLSFLCYNAFYDNGIIFIDEPELSLHVDWQRMLFDVLMEQGTQNQLIVATHSPFIYSQFPDKELILDDDKGGE
ncbi:MAG: ATP-binding protein [Candidatus Parabeggiatoa sp.]|nr:ATP-binding protein [Candidatus Parabeggiatoa sp.]